MGRYMGIVCSRKTNKNDGDWRAMICPSKTFKVDKFVITRYYNNNKDVFGGKDYVDVIEEPFYMTDLDGLDKKDRKVVEDFMEKQPKKYIG